jgi:hypothetical protein
VWVPGHNLVVLLALVGSACASQSNCDRSGCDALKTRAVDTGKTGIDGFVAEESDVVANGCQQCSLGSAHIDFWTDAIVPAGLPTASVDANGRYSLGLDAGSYVACVGSDCVNVTVHANHVTTLNVRVTFGPPQFFVYEPG